jgi:tryptophan-rich sensory protein
MIKNKYFSFLLIFSITLFASVLGSFVTKNFKEPWYSELILPSFNPPSWVFAPVWIMLYLMMSFAIWRVWVKTLNIKILKIYFFHLFFNSIWSIIFFGFHNIGIALINLILILTLILILMKIYYKVEKISFYLMIPYFLWTSYALLLNSSIFLLNNN